MSVSEILLVQRVSVANAEEGLVRDKTEALQRLAAMLADGEHSANEDQILRVLMARERLQSTGVGEGVAVPHGSMEELDCQVAALLLCPDPIDFGAIDGAPVNILFALVGPKAAPAQHLKILARVSRMLRHSSFREQLLNSSTGSAAHQLICETEGGASK